MTRPIGIDLFAGAGGLSLGFEQAGFEVVAAVEVDPVHCAVHKFNFPECAIIARSVSDVRATDIRAAAHIGDAEVDCVFGGPPCQGFSLIGHRALDDPRNGLVKDFVRLVTELQPRTFLFENVKGLTVGRHKSFLEELVEAFDAAGYRVRLPWRVLNAADFNVPQNRERLILLGARGDVAIPDYPSPITARPDVLRPGLTEGPTCADAIADLPDADLFEELAYTDAVLTKQWGEPSQYARELRGTTNATWHFGHMRKWDPMCLTSSWRTEHTEISRRRFAETRPGSVEPVSRFFRLDPEGLCNTLRAGTDGRRGAFTSPRPIHYEYPRCITVREMARLHGFPDWFRLHSTKWHGARQVGNSVPPPLARVLGQAIASAINFSPKRSSDTLQLGDENWLRLDVTGAAQQFAVPVPITRRDRKSGAKKRKQHEIEAERLALNLEGGDV